VAGARGVAIAIGVGVVNPEAWGIAAGHHHVRGDWVPAPSAGVAAALAAMGAGQAGEEPPPTSTWVVDRREGLQVPFAGTVDTEDGGAFPVEGWVPPEALPLGYHWLTPRGLGSPIRLIVSPGVCPTPDRGWGWAVQLYATRSRSSWGIGDLADLRRLRRWSSIAFGPSMILINPLHAVAPIAEQQASPYFPASRRWRNPLYLRVDEVPGAAEVSLPVEAGLALNVDQRIDRAAIWRVKRETLWQIWCARPGLSDFEAWSATQGDGLRDFAIWSALTEELSTTHGADWRSWPEAFRRPGTATVGHWAAVPAHAEIVRFHAWLQWLLSRQLAAATAPGEGGPIVTDLAIGGDPGGADAWQWQDVLATGVSVGAPPDEFSPGGQDWGLPPFDPWRLRSAGYEPFVQVLRASLSGGGGVRIDHVAGLFRLFWVPEGQGPCSGVYVRYPWADLLNIVALEAARAGAFVIGEDLGTVEPDMRAVLAQRGVLSYRLLWFEDRPPAEWPTLALAAVTTHDLPTVAGVWSGADVRARHHLGLPVDDDAESVLRDRLRAVAGEGGVTAAVRAAYGALSEAPSLLVTATLDDVLEVEERPNIPGTTDERPNWSLALPLPLEEIQADPRVATIADVLRSREPT